METSQKLRGGYYTPQNLAAFLTKWVLEAAPTTVLEPACGDGVFLQAIQELSGADVPEIVACELDGLEAAKARKRMRPAAKGPAESIYAVDFLGWALERLDCEAVFDAVLGNPPFVRYQYLDEAAQCRAEQVFRRFDLRFTRHTNAWVPFVVASIGLLRPGGRLAMVIPSEILHVLHATSLRRFLLKTCSRVLVLDPESILFEETLQGTVLLLAEKAAAAETPRGKLAVVPVPDSQFLNTWTSDFFSSATYVDASVVNGKWMRALLSTNELGVLDSLEQRADIRRFAEVASVDVGIVTGANKFFLVPDSVVEEYDLHRWVHPMFGRSDHVPGIVYDHDVHNGNSSAGLSTNFVWFDRAEREDLSKGAQAYIEMGEGLGLQSRYKCRIRSPWYSVPSVYSTSVGMLKRAHHFPRLVWNRLGAYTTDTAYRIQPAVGRSPQSLVGGFVNSLTALSSELEGRHYGGGVLELVPSEIEKVLVPVAERLNAAVGSLDADIRTGMSPGSILERADARVLGELGVASVDQVVVRSAWERLRRRRQRK